MRIDLNGLRVLSGLMFVGCLLSACGGDEAGDDDAGAGEGGAGGSSGGSRASGGAGQGGAAGKGGAGRGGSTATGGTTASGGTGGGSGGSAGKASNPTLEDCEAPAAPLESCYAENDDRPGTAVCSEYYVAGAAALFCESPEAGGCPRDAELEGICLGGVTSSFYYADSANSGFWDATEPGCEINAGTWCSE